MMLAVEHLFAGYGGARILEDVSLTIGRGEVLALLGRNGAGKSTTLKALMGLVPQRTGQIRFAGQDITRLPPFAIARLGLGYVPEERRIFTELTVEENLMVGAQPPREGVPAWTPARLYALFPNLGAMKDRPGGRMSGGEQQMLTMARTLMGNPALVLLDEPSEGLAPRIVEDMARAILTLKAEGLSILLSEQNLRFARIIADRVAVIERGQIRFTDSFTAFDAQPDIRDRWLAA